MATLVEETIRDAVQSLVKRDSDLAQRTFEFEDRINKIEITVAFLFQFLSFHIILIYSFTVSFFSRNGFS